MSYRVLVLPPIERMTLPVLRKIRDLVAGGATVLGPKPRHTPGLAGSLSQIGAAVQVSQVSSQTVRNLLVTAGRSV